MYEMIDNNPFYKVFLLLGVGIGVALVIRIVQNYVLALVKDRRKLRKIERWEFRVKAFIWIGYSSWALYHLLKVNLVVTLVILAVIFVAGWRSWMEFYAGIILRLERRIQMGDKIETASGAGRVEHFHFQSLAMMTDDGLLVHIPYRKVTGDMVAQSTEQEKLMAQSFAVMVSTDRPQEMKQQITELVKACPWTAVLQPIQVNYNGDGTFKVTARSIDNSVFYKLEMYVNKRLDSLSN